jgi:hypothetical protein
MRSGGSLDPSSFIPSSTLRLNSSMARRLSTPRCSSEYSVHGWRYVYLREVAGSLWEWFSLTTSSVKSRLSSEPLTSRHEPPLTLAST